MSVNCIHGHRADCGCGDCKIARCGRATVPLLREPQQHALIECQIQTGPGRTWTNRTYEVVRSADGQWCIDFGEGTLEPARSWEDVLDWLRCLGPRDVALLEIT